MNTETSLEKIHLFEDSKENIESFVNGTSNCPHLAFIVYEGDIGYGKRQYFSPTCNYMFGTSMECVLADDKSRGICPERCNLN